MADQALDTLYVTGGAAELPPVARILRESFGRKVRRSAYMRSASAIGLAIRASDDMAESGEDHVQEQFNRNFGLWRETDHGGTIFFDLIFPRGVQLPASGEAASARGTHLPAGAQHWALPLSRELAARRQDAAEGRDCELGSDSVSL